LNQVSRRTFARAGAALCAASVFCGNAAQAVFEGPGPIELGTGATHIQLIRVRRAVPYRRAILHLDNLMARVAHGVPYRIYLNRSHTLETIVFGSAPSHRAFDVTAVLPLGDRIVVSFLPQRAPAHDAAPRIGRLSLDLA